MILNIFSPAEFCTCFLPFKRKSVFSAIISVPSRQKATCKLQIRNLYLRIPQTFLVYRHKRSCMRPVSSPMLQHLPLICPISPVSFFFFNLSSFSFLRFLYTHCFRDFLSFHKVFLSLLSAYLHSFVFRSKIFRFLLYVFNFQIFSFTSLLFLFPYTLHFCYIIYRSLSLLLQTIMFSRKYLIILNLLPSLLLVSFLILLRFISSCLIFYTL